MCAQVTDDAKEAACVRSQLKLVIRPMYSSPPVHGSRIVTEVLKDKALSKQWYEYIESMLLVSLLVILILACL